MAEDKKAVLLVSHGSPEAETNIQFLKLRDMLRAKRPDWRVEGGFSEAAHPLFHDVLQDLLTEGFTSIAVIPFFLFPGGYVSHDIPREIASATDKHPDAKVKCGKTLTEQPKFVSILAEQVPSDAIKAGGTVAIMVMAGGVAAENRETIERIRTEFHQHVGIDTRYGFVDRGDPLMAVVMGKAVDEKPESIIVLPCFLFTGIFMRSLRRAVEGFQMSHEKITVTLLEPFGLNSRMLVALEEMAAGLLAPEA